MGETIEILKTGYIELGRSREATEVINLGHAIDVMQSNLLNDPAPFTEKNLLDFHGILLKGINDSIAGRFRAGRVMILGAKHQPPSEREVPGLITTFLEQLNSPNGGEKIDPIVLASWCTGASRAFTLSLTATGECLVFGKIWYFSGIGLPARSSRRSQNKNTWRVSKQPTPEISTR